MFDHRMLLPWEFQRGSGRAVSGDQGNSRRKAGLVGLSALTCHPENLLLPSSEQDLKASH